MISPTASVVAVAGGLTALAASRIVSVGSLSAAAAAVAGAGVERIRTGERAPLAFAGVAAALICIRHAPNLKRLLRGQEPRVSLRRPSGGS
jgi:glycerol-3-phosphate acyltransferase PlsY